MTTVFDLASFHPFTYDSDESPRHSLRELEDIPNGTPYFFIISDVILTTNVFDLTSFLFSVRRAAMHTMFAHCHGSAEWVLAQLHGQWCKCALLLSAHV
jgi:hypothetical protein